MIIFSYFQRIPSCKLVPLEPSVEIGAGPGQRISMEIPGYGGSLLLVLKYSNISTRTVDCNP